MERILVTSALADLLNCCQLWGPNTPNRERSQVERGAIRRRARRCVHQLRPPRIVALRTHGRGPNRHRPPTRRRLLACRRGRLDGVRRDDHGRRRVHRTVGPRHVSGSRRLAGGLHHTTPLGGGPRRPDPTSSADGVVRLEPPPDRSRSRRRPDPASGCPAPGRRRADGSTRGRTQPTHRRSTGRRRSGDARGGLDRVGRTPRRRPTRRAPPFTPERLARGHLGRGPTIDQGRGMATIPRSQLSHGRTHVAVDRGGRDTESGTDLDARQPFGHEE